MRTNGAWAIVARIQDAKGEVVGQIIQLWKLIPNKQLQLSLALPIHAISHLRGTTSGTLQTGYNRLSNNNLL